MFNKMIIDGIEISETTPPYIIAEMSGNHNGDLNRALRLIELAKESGASAVKLQTYTPDTMTINHKSSDFMVKEGLWKGYSLYDLYEMAHTPWEWHKALYDKGKQIGITVFSTPFDNTSVDFLESLNTPVYKISSFENCDIPLIRKIASTKKPVIMSTGMSNLSEIEDSVYNLKKYGCNNLALLHCVSGYPTKIDESNLQTIIDLKSKFKTIIGLSDHTMGNVTSVVAIGLGAKIIEKHFTLNRADGGPDSSFSLHKEELKNLVNACNKAFLSLGNINYEKKPSEKNSFIFRRSVYVVKNVEEGETFTKENIRVIRPGFGSQPKTYDQILGKKSNRKLHKGTPFSMEFLS